MNGTFKGGYRESLCMCLHKGMADSQYMFSLQAFKHDQQESHFLNGFLIWISHLNYWSKSTLRYVTDGALFLNRSQAPEFFHVIYMIEFSSQLGIPEETVSSKVE